MNRQSRQQSTQKKERRHRMSGHYDVPTRIRRIMMAMLLVIMVPRMLHIMMAGMPFVLQPMIIMMALMTPLVVPMLGPVIKLVVLVLGLLMPLVLIGAPMTRSLSPGGRNRHQHDQT